MVLSGGLQFKADIKEALLEEMNQQEKAAGIETTPARIERIERNGNELLLYAEKTAQPIRAKRVIVAIGRSGAHRKLGCPGENLDKVYNRLYDPKDYSGMNALVIGGGDTALETAIALAIYGAEVTLSYRKNEFSRPKQENIDKLRMLEKDPGAAVAVVNPTSERVTTAASPDLRGDQKPGHVRLALGTTVKEIRTDSVVIQNENGKESVLPNDVVFTMIGREAPLDFFRRSGIKIHGEWSVATWAGFLSFFLFCIFLYNWKSNGAMNKYFQAQHWFPYNIPDFLSSISESFATQISDRSNFLGTMAISLRDPSFYYSLVYCLCIVIFGIQRIKRRKTPYVKAQTISLMLIQVIPLFLLPFVVLPFLGHNGWFDSGMGKYIADHLFPSVTYGHGREYWRAVGFILAWPLFIWNVFTSQPMGWWLAISFVQTFVIIPLIIWRWGKGAYCGWICSCGALAETMGDAQRTKMPHGPVWNRLNMVGQVVLAAALILLFTRILTWVWPTSAIATTARTVYQGLLNDWKVLGIPLNYYHVVDIFLAGIIGVGMYFWFSGRVWCRFACPLAALMHIYTRFSRFRIFADKKKCISCNVCTSVCHQGIDIMNFANKGMGMEDPQCVRCSACVQMCPTGTLTFGRIGTDGNPVFDRMIASLVQIREPAKRDH